jgi:hypothetical protein
MLGIHKFYLFSNECNSTVPYPPALQRFQDIGVVVLSRKYECDSSAAGYNIQEHALLDGVNAAKEAGVAWVGVFDIDENFVPVNASSSIPEILVPFHANSSIAMVTFRRLVSVCVHDTCACVQCGSVLVCAQGFGPSDHVRRPSASAITAYTRHVHPHMRPPQPGASGFKAFVRVAQCLQMHVHGCSLFRNSSDLVVKQDMVRVCVCLFRVQA